MEQGIKSQRILHISYRHSEKYKSTKKTSYTIKKATYDRKYAFKVCAYDKKKKTGAFSPVKEVTVTPSKPKTPTTFTLSSKGDRSITLKWSGASKCSGGYIIQLYNEDTKTFENYKTISSKSTKKITFSNLIDNTTYQFRIIGVRKVAGKVLYGTPSKIVSVTATAFSDEVKSVRTARYKAVTKKSVKVKVSSTKKYITLNKGVSLTTSGKKGTTTGYLKDGTKISISTSALRFKGWDCSTKNDYSKSTKEKYINAKGYSSKTNYLIWISQYKLKVNVYKGSRGKWKLQKEFPCVIGAWNARTASGLHKILKSVRYGEHGGPYMHFSSGASKGGTAANPIGCAFHNQVDSTMSKAASHGCCRLRLNDLIWLYNHCKVGTTVLVY